MPFTIITMTGPYSPSSSQYPTNPPSLSASSRRIPPPCWSQEETAALIDAYRDKWYSLQRGNLRATHWQEVSDDVADICHVSSGNPRKTSIQCRHKMEKLKKRYRGEVSRAAVRKGQPYLSSWVHFKQMDLMEKGSFYSDPAVDPVNQDQDQDDEEEEEEANPLPINKRFYNSNENGFRVKIPGRVLDYPLLKSYYGSGKGLRDDYDKSGSGFGFAGNRAAGGNSDNPEEDMVVAIKRLGDVYVRIEKMRMDTVNEVELMRMEMKMKRTKMIIESQERLVDSFSNAGLEKKIKRMTTPES